MAEQLTEIDLLLDKLSKNVHGYSTLKKGTRAEFRQTLQEILDLACRANSSVDQAPAMPVGLSIDPQETALVLGWDPNTESDLAGYNVYRAEAEGGPYTKLTSGGLRTVADYTDTTAVAGTKYWYRVSAVDNGGNESAFSVTSGTRPAADVVAPAAPANVTATPVGINDVLIDWDPNNEADLAGYNISRSTTSGSGYVQQNSAILTVSEYRDTTTVAGTTYYYRVTAEDTSGNESTHTQIQYDTPATDTTPPAVPTGFVAVPSTSGIQLSWAANVESDFDEYEVDRSPDGVGSWTNIATPSSPTHNDTTATAGVVSYYRIRAKDATGNASGYLTGSATRLTGSTPAETLIPTHVGSLVPCVVHTRLVNRTSWSNSTGLTTISSGEFPSFGTQNPLLTQYEHNFAAGEAEPQGDYPQLRGFNAAHVYDQAGTYTITGTVTPPDRGTPTNYSTTRTFAADTRTRVYVTENGAGTGSGSTTDTAVSPARAQQILNASTTPHKLLFERGKRYQQSGSTPILDISKNNTLVDAWGSGEKPKFEYSGSGSNFRVMIRVRSGVQNTFIQNLQFDQLYNGVGHEGYIGVQGAINTCVRDCDVHKADRFIDPGDDGCSGLLLVRCINPTDQTRRDFFTGIAKGSDWVLLGCKVSNTLEEGAFRASGLDRLLLHDCHLREGKQSGTTTPSDDYNGALRLQNGNFYYVRKCHIEHIGGGGGEIGPLDQCTGQQKGRVQYVVLEQNLIEAQLKGNPGSGHVMLRNNIFDWQGDDILFLQGYYYNHPDCSPAIKFEKGNKDWYVYNNTFVLNSGSGDAFVRMGSMEAEQGENGIPAVTGPVRFRNNYFVAGSGLSSSSYNARFVSETLEDDSIESDRNVWSSVVRFRKDTTAMDLGTWNAQADVETDDQENVAFAQDYVPGVSAKARTFGRPVQGVWEDYNGSSRSLSDATWSSGAIEV